MPKQNCWEAKRCGREPGGKEAGQWGVCPAALPSEFDGTNGGRGAGRFCWVIAGTYCHGEKQGTFAKKLMSCLECDFLKQVHEEEGREFVLTPRDRKKIR